MTMPTNKRIYLSPPHIGGYEKKYVEDAFQSNWIAPLGPHVDAFEQEVAQFAGSRGAVALSSGTAAIHLALRLADIGEGDYVFCSSLTFVASANPILYLGAKPVFIDSDPYSWNMSAEVLERACKEREYLGLLPKAAIVVNLYGQSADMNPLMEICSRYGIVLIEDAAESLGATYRGKASGTYGKFGVFSFNGNKIITTSGGGMLVSDDLDALEKARFWATQARDAANHYQHSQLGYNYRLSNVLSAIGRGQLTVLEQHIEKRRKVFQTYSQQLSYVPGIRFMPEMAYGKSTRWLTAFTLDPEQSGTTTEQMLFAMERRNIEARKVWKPLHLQPLFADCSYYPYAEEFSVSAQLFANGMCLPSGSSLTEEEQHLVMNTVEGCIQKNQMSLH